MTSLGGIGFLQPLFLIGLLLLPLLWWLLRATPPSPRRVRFPGVAVLLGLEDRESTPRRTPLWLLILRCLAAALLLLAFSEPLLNPKARLAEDGPLLLVMDGGWGDAAEWDARRRTALDFAEQAAERERPVAFVSLAAAEVAPERLEFAAAEAAIELIAALQPQPWAPDPTRIGTALEAFESGDRAGPIEVIWLHDGLAHEGDEAIAGRLQALGSLRMIGPVAPPLALAPPQIRDGKMYVSALRAEAAGARAVRIAAIGAPRASEEDEDVDLVAAATRAERRLSTVEATFAEGALRAEVEIDLPTAIRNALSRLEIVGELSASGAPAAHAGAAQLLDDRWRRRTVALVSGEIGQESQPLLSGLHYLRAALAPHAAYREARLAQALGASSTERRGASAEEFGALAGWADAIVLSDIGRLDQETEDALIGWVEKGGLLIRFAGVKLAALAEEELGYSGQALEESPLLPTRLRGGGRALGGALSWESPQPLRAFPETSPFFGLEVGPEVTVKRQVLAEPGPELSERVWAALADGTPLVTAKSLGEGRVVLFHVTANAEWSSLPLSGLFVEMMGRLVSVAPALAASEASLAEDARSWTPVRLMDGFGRVADAPGEAAPLPGESLAQGVRIGVAPGLYETETESGEIASLALSALDEDDILAPRAPPPLGAASETLSGEGETPLKPWLLSAATSLLLLDILAALLVAGRLRTRHAALALATAAALGAWAAPQPSMAQAQTEQRGGEAAADEDRRVDPAEQYAALETVLAYVVTSDPAVDRVSSAGLLGLSAALYQRTAIEPGEPAGVDLEIDDISVFAILYWPITSRQPDLTDNAIRKLNAFMRTGGLLVVDTRDAHQTFGGGGGGPNEGHLRRLLSRLDLPRLEPVRPEHVLTRTYYILDELPGRWRGAVWVEATNRARGPLPGGRRALFEAAANDGVSPIIIGAADWAGAWAITDDGDYLYPMGQGGDRQREYAYRFGVNLAMYAFTGNYKSDQVHIPALLDRLGN